MHKTLLLCFIHGFKGGDDTFASFPSHIQALLSHSLPNISIQCLIYPQFETRGDIRVAVKQFRDWLQNKVIDIEVSNGTSSPTLEPSVHVILVGHSMGGIVAAETLFSIASEESIPASSTTSAPSETPDSGSKSTSGSESATANSMSEVLFPCVSGILAFDTPYLGIAPSVLAHNAESQYKTVSSAYETVSNLWSTFSPPAASTSEANASAAMAATATASTGWSKWGKIAGVVAGAGALAAGGTAAYLNRESITSSWTWANSHLEFIGCLMRGEDLKARVDRLAGLRDRGNGKIGWMNLYTVLGKEGSSNSQGSMVSNISTLVGDARRTFCNVPQRPGWKTSFEGTINDKARNEIEAHMWMFTPRDNPGYYTMAERAKEVITGWVLDEKKWYESSEPKSGAGIEIPVDEDAVNTGM